MKWTHEEIKELKKFYPREDITILDLMKKFNRTKRAICHKSSRLDLRRPKSKKSKRDIGLRKKYDREYYQRNKDNLMKLRKKKYRKLKRDMVNLMGGACSICKYNKCISALEFHHEKGTKKDNSVGFLISRGCMRKAREEVKKCILLCSNCHRELHFKERN